MSESNELPRTHPAPPPPAVPGPSAQPPSSRLPMAEALVAAAAAAAQPSRLEQEARERLAVLEREARALGTDPRAALFFHEMGLLWEEPLKNPRNAAVAFQNAYRLAPRLLVNIRSARRLFADVGNWQMVVQLLDAELAATDSTRDRAGLLYEKGLLLEERLGQAEAAAAAYRQCLELKPADVPLLTQLEAFYAARGDYASLVEVYRLLAATLEQPALRAHYLTAAGLVLEERLRQPEAAVATWREAFALDRSDLVLLASLKRVAEREGRQEELLEVLAAEARALGSQAAPTLLHLSKVYERLGRPQQALDALLEARRASPSEPLVLSTLAEIYETQGRFEELADVLLAWVGCINDESEMVAINLRLAALYEEELKREQDAIARYQAILGRIPSHTTALANLGKLYYRTRNWEGLASIFESEAAVAEERREKAGRTFKAAEVYEERLGRLEEAIARYQQCLQFQPGYLPAQKALTRLYERQGRYAELVAMHEQDLLQTSDKEQIVATLDKMALLYEERLGDLPRAIDCVKRILEVMPDHLAAIRNLSRLYERAGQWRELILNMELECALVGDTKQVLSLRHRSAEILDEHIKDRAGAIAAYERVLSISPSYLPALKALGRLYAQEGRWEELIRMYRAEAEITTNTEAAAALIYKIGELYEHRLKDEHSAVASYQEVLTLAPSYFPALRALARLYRGQGAWESLVEVLRSEAANRTDPAERANVLYQAAVIWEERLGRPEMAVEVYQEVLRLTPGHAATLRSLERLYLARGDDKGLVSVLDRETQVGQTVGARVAAYVKLARLYLDHFQEPARAAQCCEAALALEPGHLLALKTLERIRAGDKTRRAELRGRLAEHVSEPRLRTALRLGAAVDVERAGSEGALEAWRQAFAEDPRDTRLAFILERGLRHAGDAAGLAGLYARRLEVATDAEERLELHLRLGELYEGRLNDLERSAQAWRAALELKPQYLPALQGLRRVLVRRGEAAAARAVLESEAQACRDVRGTVEALVAAARLAAGPLNDTEGAMALYRQALEKEPTHEGANAGLEELVAARGGMEDVVLLQERRGEQKLRQGDGEGAAQAFTTAARALFSTPEGRKRAVPLLDKALSASPGLGEALELRGQLYLEAQQYAEAAALLAQRAQQGGEPSHVLRLHLLLGGLYQDRLGEPSRAMAHLLAVLNAQPRQEEALERLSSLYRQARNWAGAAECLRRLLELELAPDSRVRHTLTLAQVYEEGLGDTAHASALYRKAVELAPGDSALLERLVGLYERAGNTAELVQMLEAQVAQALSSGDPKRANALRLRLGELYVHIQQPTRAVTTLRQVLEVEPTSVQARATLASLYTRDSATIQLAIEEHRNLLRLDPTRVDSLHTLFKLWEGLKQQDKAFSAAAVLHFLRSADEAEVAFYSEAKLRLAQEASSVLQPADVDTLLMHPLGRGPLLETLRAIGDQLERVHPPQFELLGVDRKTDKLKPEHAFSRAIRGVAQVFSVDTYEVYQARRGFITLEPTEVPAVCVGQDLVRRFNAREQKFLIGRAVLGLLNKSAVLSKLSQGETAELFGSSLRIFTPQLEWLGRRNEDLVKQLKRTYSRKAMKALEPVAQIVASGPRLDLISFLNALGYSADRAGLLMGVDVSVGLSVLLREDPLLANTRLESPEPILREVREREDIRELMLFALSDDFFRLRQKLGISL